MHIGRAKVFCTIAFENEPSCNLKHRATISCRIGLLHYIKLLYTNFSKVELKRHKLNNLPSGKVTNVSSCVLFAAHSSRCNSSVREIASASRGLSASGELLEGLFLAWVFRQNSILYLARYTSISLLLRRKVQWCGLLLRRREFMAGRCPPTLKHSYQRVRSHQDKRPIRKVHSCFMRYDVFFTKVKDRNTKSIFEKQKPLYNRGLINFHKGFHI